MRMPLGENAKMALATLRENKMRSFLTVLGVVIGITALITVASILVGFYGDVTAYLDDYGPNTIWIFKFSPGLHTGRLTTEERNRKPLTLEDALAIREQCPSVSKVSTSIFKRVDDYNRPPLITARYKDKEVSGLDYSGTLGRGNPTEGGILSVIVENSRIGKIKLRVVKRVEELRPKLDPDPL